MIKTRYDILSSKFCWQNALVKHLISKKTDSRVLFKKRLAEETAELNALPTECWMLQSPVFVG